MKSLVKNSVKHLGVYMIRGNRINGSDLCKRCRIREILSGGNVSELDIVHDFTIHNEHVIKHLYFTTNRVVMDGKKLRIVNIEDRTSKH